MRFTADTALLLVAIGLGVGAFGTLIGAGGGFILTPILLLLYPHDSAQTLTAISLTAVFFNAASGTTAYARQRRIDYRSGLVFALATLPGSIAGALVVGTVSRQVFDTIMGLVLALLAAWLLFGERWPLPKPCHHLEHRVRVDLRPGRRPPIARRPFTPRQPRDRPPIDPQPARDLPLRDSVRRQRSHLRPLQRAPHLHTLSLDITDPSSLEGEADAIGDAASGALFAYRFRCSIWAPGIRLGPAPEDRSSEAGAVDLRDRVVTG